MMHSWLLWPETKTLLKAFADAGAEIRFVGGCVRDSLLELPVQDIDAATPVPPQQAMQLLEKAGIKAIPTGIDHGTVTAIVNGRTFEITTLRKDVATDGRHAKVEYTDDWRADAARRDFTINAFYLSPSGQLFDYFNGSADLKAGRVRFIGDANARIREDYLRILRFFRFFARFGKGEVDEEGLASCAANARGIESLSGERIQQELLKLLAARGCYEAVVAMHEEGILPHLFGFDVRDCAMLSRFEAIARLAPMPSYLKLSGFFLKASLPADQALDAIAKRLRLPVAMTKDLQSALLHYDEIEENLPEAAQKKLLRKLGAERFSHAVMVQWAYGNDMIGVSHPYLAMLKLAQSWKPPVFPVTGDDLIKLGIKPGKEMGERLKKLEELWEESGYTLSKEQLLK